MKRCIIALMIALTIFSGCNKSLPVEEEISGENFIVIATSVPEELEKADYRDIYARYKDDKTPITLSMHYNGKVYATIPEENKLREIEAFIPEKIKFSDYKSSVRVFEKINTLAKTGIISGDEKGKANPFMNISRSEAVVMVMNFFGIAPSENQEMNFTDVLPEDLYYGYIAAAYERGIISGDTETEFLPHNDILREELTVIIAKALKYAGLRCPPVNDEIITDKDKISDWAVDAYEYMGRLYISDYDDSNPNHPVRVLNPQKEVTRAEIAEILVNVAKKCQNYPSDTAVKYGFDKKMPVIDGSEFTYSFAQVIYGTLFSNGNTHEQYPEDYGTGYESYERLILGKSDMLFTYVQPPTDILEFAKKKKVDLELIPVARDAIVFFTNADNKSEGITKEQLRNIYINNAYTNWSELDGANALIYPYCMNNNEVYAQTEKLLLSKTEINEKIKNEKTSETMSDILTDVMKAKTKRPLGYGLGYSLYYYFNNVDLFYNTKKELKLLKIDGIYPDDETIADGSYPLSNNIYIVVRKDSSDDSPERKMIDFMLSGEGQLCVELAGFGRL